MVQGKSTLIKIITGEQLPDEGTVAWQKNIHVGYLDNTLKSIHIIYQGFFENSLCC